MLVCLGCRGIREVLLSRMTLLVVLWIPHDGMSQLQGCERRVLMEPGKHKL